MSRLKSIVAEREMLRNQF